jgi:crotonobetainyl-CoA:carnitine CoA-transferase CaiB-like acyl-CoA transferase
LLSGYVGASFECAGEYNAPLFPLGNEDPGNGLLGAIGVLLALLDRNQHGSGHFVVNPQLNAAMCHVAHIVRVPGGDVRGSRRLDPLQMGFAPLDRLYETSDGWICVSAFTDAEIDAVGRAIGHDLRADERFRDRASRSEYWYALERLLTESFACMPTEQAVSALDRERAPAVAPVLTTNGVAVVSADAHLASGRTANCSHPEWGIVREVASLVRVSDAGTVVHRGAPGLGEHTDEILAWLGYDDGRVASLRARGVIR